MPSVLALIVAALTHPQLPSFIVKSLPMSQVPTSLHNPQKLLTATPTWHALTLPPDAAEITRLEEEFQAQQSGHVPMHDVDSNDARARLWSVAAFNRSLGL
jgi:hypothetical protein